MSSLSSDIILEVMHYLRRPIPPAHTLRTERSEIRQPDLFACLRVCKLWYNCAAPTLYKYAITDNFHRFLHRQRGPRTKWAPDIAGIIPKIELLSRVQRLFIEYSHKDGERYDEEDEAVRWAIESSDKALGDQGEEFRRHPQFEWGIQLASEARQLSAALGGTTGWLDLSLSTVFQRLQTLSIGAFFGKGKEEEVYGKCTVLDMWDEYGQIVRDTQRSFCQLVSRIPTLVSYCQTSSSGPLSFGDIPYLPRKNDSRPAIAVHTHDVLQTSPNPAIGVPSSVYYHKAQREGNHPVWFAKDASTDAFFMLQTRNALARNERRTTPDWSLDQTRYQSISPIVDRQLVSGILRPLREEQPRTPEGQAKWRLELDMIQEFIRIKMAACKSGLPEGIEPVDKLEWKQLFDAPPCGGCGWRYEE